MIKHLLQDYGRKKAEIKNRIKDFEELGRGKDEDIFSELCFCLLTPQSKAINCDKAITSLKDSGKLFEGCASAIRDELKGDVRFHNNKSRYIIAARDLFKNGKCVNLKSKIRLKDAFETREWLVKNIKGLGYKEASHFLRNIGLGKNIAILDRHILKNLKRFNVIKEIPKTLSKKAYLEIENRMRKFSQKINIPLDELDLLLWSQETGVIFK